VAGKGIFIEFEKECAGNDCAGNGDHLQSNSIGLVGSMLGTEDLSGYSTKLSETFRNVIGNIGKEGEEGAVNDIVRNLEVATRNLAALTESSNKLVAGSQQNLSKTLASLTVISASLAKSNQKIEGLLTNMDKISQDVADANLGNTISKANGSLDQLSATLVSTNTTMNELTALLSKVQKGDGTVAKMVNDRKLYENLESTTKNLNLLLQDLRLNPKRYAHFSVFGKKQSSYTLPADDPASATKGN
jgi:phospholipid/cholesterol/gamma-HCH transport system substrate-binding protein